MKIRNNNDVDGISALSVTIDCPLCGVRTALNAISIPNFKLTSRFKPRQVGIVYLCGSCNLPVFLRHRVEGNYEDHEFGVSDRFSEVERPTPNFEFEHLPEEVANDFKEALTSYSNNCFNAFAAMCRRCIQSSASSLGVKGKDKVTRQVQDLHDMGGIDEETHSLLKQIILDGHDGAHPHLPSLNVDRATVLLELMKDVMYQLFVRQAKLQKAMELRKQEIAKK